MWGCGAARGVPFGVQLPGFSQGEGSGPDLLAFGADMRPPLPALSSCPTYDPVPCPPVWALPLTNMRFPGSCSQTWEMAGPGLEPQLARSLLHRPLGPPSAYCMPSPGLCPQEGSCSNRCVPRYWGPRGAGYLPQGRGCAPGSLLLKIKAKVTQEG